MLDTLIIQGELVNPPTELQAFRTFTLMANNLHLHSILEIEQDAKDLYWNYIKRHRCHDFIEYIITPQEQEKGFRVDYDLVDRITFANLIGLLGFLKNFSQHCWR